MTNKTLDFSKRHIGLKDSDVEHILHDLGYQNVDTFFKIVLLSIKKLVGCKLFIFSLKTGFDF